MLGSLEDGGRVRLLPWERATEVKNRLVVLAGQSDQDDSAADALLLLLDRYPRLMVDASNRLELPNHVAAHLGVLGGGVLYVARVSERTELWSSLYRDSRVAEAAAIASDLP